MAWYMAFPVVMFWIFNRPSFYEKIMYETKKKIYVPEDPALEQMRERLKKHSKRKQLHWEEELRKMEEK